MLDVFFYRKDFGFFYIQVLFSKKLRKSYGKIVVIFESLIFL